MLNILIFYQVSVTLDLFTRSVPSVSKKQQKVLENVKKDCRTNTSYLSRNKGIDTCPFLFVSLVAYSSINKVLSLVN